LTDHGPSGVQNRVINPLSGDDGAGHDGVVNPANRQSGGDAVMDADIAKLLQRLQELETEFEETLDARREAFRYRFEKGRVIFERAAVAEHRKLKRNTLTFLRHSRFGPIILAPFVYMLIVPFLVIDFMAWIYQLVCFPVWGMERVRRDDYIRLDRHHLGYLNGIEKLNCLYCGYANGLIAYLQEVAGRTEQYWCPIKHAVRMKSSHRRYRDFIEYGDAEDFHERLVRFRKQLRKS
jgi:hypothetical protein